MQRTFDRIPRFDERSRNFRAIEGIEHYPLRSYTWRASKGYTENLQAAEAFLWHATNRLVAQLSSNLRTNA